MKGRRSSFSLLYKYISREYLLSFFVSFIFFFFIFFINQILVLVQKILLKNVSISIVLYLVLLSVPQFLLYTFPFSSLTAASMVIGDLSSKNEMLALRFSGIHLKHVFIPIVVISLFFSVGCIFISNELVPYTSEKYKEAYQKILSDLPTIEIKSYNVNNINNLILSNGLVENDVIHDLTLIDSTNSREKNVITSKQGKISLIDLDRYIYELNLTGPRVLTTNELNAKEYSLANAQRLQLFLDFSNLIPSVQSLTPSQMSIDQLLVLSKERKLDLYQSIFDNNTSNLFVYSNLGKNLRALQLEEDKQISANSLLSDYQRMADKNNQKASSFYRQYYQSEVNKKFALSLACTFLVFIAFPISFFKVRYGRLIGFALSILVSVAYWFSLFYLQTLSVETWFNPLYLIWLPNLLFFLIGIIMLLRLVKR